MFKFIKEFSLMCFVGVIICASSVGIITLYDFYVAGSWGAL